MLDFVFFLPGFPIYPVGGYKVVYQYANELVSRGYKVGIVYIPFVLYEGNRIVNSMKTFLKGLKYKKTKWFDLSDKIKVITILSYEFINSVPRSEIYFATSWETAKITTQISKIRGKKGIYLIQAIETWSASPEQLAETFHLGLKNIAISSALQEYVISTGAEAKLCFNGLDQENFFCTELFDSPKRKNISAMYHFLEEKGFQDIYEAVQQAGLLPMLTVFGAYDLPEKYLGKFRYMKQPNIDKLRDLYNYSSIFITGSRKEGWGLPASEAMLCGSAVIATDIPGHRDFAENLDTAILYKPGDVMMLKQSIDNLMSNSHLRLEIAQRGNENIKKFTITKSTDRILAIVSGA